MKNSMAKILIGLVGVFCFLAFTYWLPTEEAWGRDCLQVGEDAVLEHLKQQGWTNLKIFSNESLGVEKVEVDEIFAGMAIVTGKLKGKKFMLRALHGSRILYRGSGGFYCEASARVVVDKKQSMDMDW